MRGGGCGIEERYKELQDRGFHGPQFQMLVQVWRGQDEFVARMHLLVQEREENDRYHVHPAVLDGVFQFVGFIQGLAKAKERVGSSGHQVSGLPPPDLPRC